jgi:hypothetical protein
MLMCERLSEKLPEEYYLELIRKRTLRISSIINSACKQMHEPDYFGWNERTGAG